MNFQDNIQNLSAAVNMCACADCICCCMDIADGSGWKVRK